MRERSQGAYQVALRLSMSNSTLARIGINEGDERPGRSIESARDDSDGNEVSGVDASGSLSDAAFVRDVEDGVEMLRDGVVGLLAAVTSGRSEVGVTVEAEEEGLRPSPIGVPDRGENPAPSSSVLTTRVHRCFQTSSVNRGPGSSASGPSGVGLGAGLAVPATRYSIMPAVLGRAYSFAIAPNCAWKEGRKGTSVPRLKCLWYPDADEGGGVSKTSWLAVSCGR